MIAAGFPIKGGVVNILGLTFKENCTDLRNSKVADMVLELQSYGLEVHVHDPIASSAEALEEYGIALTGWDQLARADAIVAAVGHQELLARPLQALTAKLNQGGCFIDVKSQFDRSAIEALGFSVWRL